MYSVEEFFDHCQARQEKPWEWDFKKCYCDEATINHTDPITCMLKYKNSEFKERPRFNVSGKAGAKADCDKEAFPLYKALDWQENQTDIIRGEAMNTFITTFNRAIVNSSNKDEVYAEIGIDPEKQLSEQKPILYQNQNYQQFDLVAKNFSAFERFAIMSHTFGNFTVLPHWMNTGRYLFSKDYWDITLQSLYEFLEPLNAWKRFVDIYFLHVFVNEDYTPAELWENHFSGTIQPSDEQIGEFLEKANARIEHRGKQLTKILCSKIEKTDYAFYEEIREVKGKFSNHF
ncbi:hypothetical protein [Enterococcus sp. AZ072]|uniref:hypothetical protein n=1 Tax=unclassified Enterococcus TaxID=2608891 RepID=UPI003D2655AC